MTTEPRRYRIVEGKHISMRPCYVYRLSIRQGTGGEIIETEDVDEMKEWKPSKRKQFYDEKKPNIATLACSYGSILEFYDSDDPWRGNGQEGYWLKKGYIVLLEDKATTKKYIKEADAFYKKEAKEDKKDKKARDKLKERDMPVNKLRRERREDINNWLISGATVLVLVVSVLAFIFK